MAAAIQKDQLCRRKDLSVECLGIVFFFVVILLFDLRELSFIQPERLELVHSSDDLARERKRQWVVQKNRDQRTRSPEVVVGHVSLSICH